MQTKINVQVKNLTTVATDLDLDLLDLDLYVEAHTALDQKLWCSEKQKMTGTKQTEALTANGRIPLFFLKHIDLLY